MDYSIVRFDENQRLLWDFECPFSAELFETAIAFGEQRHCGRAKAKLMKGTSFSTRLPGIQDHLFRCSIFIIICDIIVDIVHRVVFLGSGGVLE